MYRKGMCVFYLFETPTFCELFTEAEAEVLNGGGQPGDVVDVLPLGLPGRRHPTLDLLHGLCQVVGSLGNISDLTGN